MIAYYAHHHGSGHANRAVAIANALDEPVVGLSSRPAPAGWRGRWVVLADDAIGADRERDDVTAGSTVHWAPRRHPGLRDRMAQLSEVLRDHDVRLLVSDVSVEVALLARLHGVPVVVVAQPGRRTDRAHRLAFDLAEAIIAPWPRRPSPDWPDSWSAKTVHVGALSRFDGRPTSSGVANRVLVLTGSGGFDVPVSQIRAAAAATPRWAWEVAGQPESCAGADDQPANLRFLGWVTDPWPLLTAATVVVTHAGQNALAEVAAARRSAVVIPQARPFDEQRATAGALVRARIGMVAPTWPAPERWPATLTQARARGGRDWERWSSGDGAVVAASVLREVARRR